ncbi:MAG: DnaJ domain-containing protein [bacterium]
MSRIPPWLLVVLLVLYLVSPIDLVPDFLGPAGRVDDILAVVAGLLFLQALRTGRRLRNVRGSRAPHAEEGGREQADAGACGPEKDAGRDPADPYEVLGVSRDAPMEEIRARYKEQLLRYHPDRVHHLGREFQELADQKTKRINTAFGEIVREKSPKA